MNRVSELFEKVFAAAAFAEHGEWDEALRICDGSLRTTHQTGAKERRTLSKKDKRAGSSRPQLRL